MSDEITTGGEGTSAGEGHQPSLKAAVRAEQVRVLYSNLLPVLGGNFLVATLLAVGLHKHVDQTLLAIWTISLYVLTTARIPLFLAYRRRSREKQSEPRWAYYFVLSSFLSGLVWGTAGVVFFQPGDSYMLILVTLVIMGMVAGSTSSLASYLPTHVAFSLPAGLPLAASYLWVGVGEQTFLVLGILLLFFILMTLLFSGAFQRTFVGATKLRLANTALVTSLMREKEKAEEASAAKSRFLASASHDLRQPLHALGLFVGAMEAHSTNTELHELIGKTKASVHALEGLMDALLDISKLDAGVVQPRIVETPLGTLFESIRNEFTPVAEEKGLRFRVHDCRFWTRTDPAMLERILRNLVSNAIRYTDSGCVLVGCRVRGEQLLVEVRDSGKGIPAEAQGVIFREFRQLDNPERDRTKGLGLGLAIVDRLSRLLKHPVRLWSEPGKGSIFSVEIPRLAPRAMPAEPEPTPSLNLLEGIHVLVIDDEVAIRDGMRTLLEGWGCRVTPAESGSDAALKLTQMNWAPDVIIADFRLREGETGLEAIAVVRELYRNAQSDIELETIPAIVLTGETEPDKLKAVKASGLPILHKPLRPARLRTTLNRLVAV